MTTRRDFLRRSAQCGAAAVSASCLSALKRCADAEANSNTANSSVWQIGCYTRPWAAYDYRVAFDAIA